MPPPFISRQSLGDATGLDEDDDQFDQGLRQAHLEFKSISTRGKAPYFQSRQEAFNALMGGGKQYADLVSANSGSVRPAGFFSDGKVAVRLSNITLSDSCGPVQQLSMQVLVVSTPVMSFSLSEARTTQGQGPRNAQRLELNKDVFYEAEPTQLQTQLSQARFWRAPQGPSCKWKKDVAVALKENWGQTTYLAIISTRVRAWRSDRVRSRGGDVARTPPAGLNAHARTFARLRTRTRTRTRAAARTRVCIQRMRTRAHAHSHPGPITRTYTSTHACARERKHAHTHA
eukprot:6202574-Pleurochrysis_carterae.AAC.1